ncbi:MAG: class I SAM-dependent methyltransferase [Candidatus Micrarchaeota archaeon]
MKRVSRRLAAFKGSSVAERRSARLPKVFSIRELGAFERKSPELARLRAKVAAGQSGLSVYQRGDLGWSLPYYSAVVEALRKRGLVRGKSVLHVACRDGRLVHFLNERGAKASGVDIQALYVQLARSSGIRGVWQGDAFDLKGVANNSQHAVVLHHFAYSGFLNSGDEGRLLTVVRRKLKPNGCVVMDCFSNWEFLACLAGLREGSGKGVVTLAGGKWHAAVAPGGTGTLVVLRKLGR